MSSTTTTLAELPSLKGQVLGVSEWFEVTQERVNAFADATDDHQWIHVDPERAIAESPFGGPIGHGFLTLSLFVPMWSQVLTVTDLKMGVNYGLNKVRFPAPLKDGQNYRLSVKLSDVKEAGNAVEGILAASIDIEGESKPACAAEIVFRFY